LLTVYRSNRAELLAQVLAAKLQLEPPDPFQQAQVIVNTWPTSRWLGEQIAIGLEAGIAANLRFPFPGSQLRQLVEALLGADASGGADPWRASQLVWPLLQRLPALLQRPEAELLRRWLEQRGHGQGPLRLDRPLWQLGRAIADAFDDYTLYRPAMLAAWLKGDAVDSRGQPLPPLQRWQPLLLGQLAEDLGVQPFGLRVEQAVERLRHWPADAGLPAGLCADQPLRLFGLSSLAPVQVQLLQAVSALLPVELYLLTPCRDLWQRLDGSTALEPLGEDWLLQAPGLEARFGRLGAEFQLLLEGSGEAQLGAWRDADLFFLAASAAEDGQGSASPRTATLLEHLQQRLADPDRASPLRTAAGDSSLEFHACPGRLRQLEIVRDRLLQLLAADPSLNPRDILVMTPQVEAFAPLVGAVFGDSEATGVSLPWRLTDRSQQSEAGISQGLLSLLALGGERLTASGLEVLLSCGPLLLHHQIPTSDAGALTALLQRAGFRWGLDASARGGDPCHSLAWAIDRLLLGLVLPEEPGLAPADTAPLAMAGSLEQQSRWLQLLGQLRRSLEQLQRPRTPEQWAPLLRQLLEQLFGDGGERAWEVQAILAAIADWRAVAGDSSLELEAAVVGEVLAERLNADSGRFGHRSGALTISALEPMRAIPHRVVVLMGLDAGQFPRQRERPGFHLMAQQRQLGDPSPGDQDRYVLLESLLSARQHLLISWSNRDERSGEALQPSTPVRQWLDLLRQELGAPPPVREHSPNPLARSNFLPQPPWPAASCDLRLLRARRQLEEQAAIPSSGLALGGPLATPAAATALVDDDAWSDLQQWLQAPQERWLAELGLRPREWGQSVADLEALRLEERERASLLRQQLQEALDNPDSSPPDWTWLQRGRGLLPPQTAGLLEAEALDQRWRSLQQCLQELGPEERRAAQLDGLNAELSWRGDALVLVHTAQVRPRQRWALWLDLLLASAAGQQPRRGVLVGREGDRFRVVCRTSVPSAAQACELLEALQTLRQQHRQRCWPVPPDTGWAYAKAEHSKPGSGTAKATSAWEGSGPGRPPGERQNPVMAVCFGATLPLRQLLHPAAIEQLWRLHQPLLEHSEEVSP